MVQIRVLLAISIAVFCVVINAVTSSPVQSGTGLFGFPFFGSNTGKGDYNGYNGVDKKPYSGNPNTGYGSNEYGNNGYKNPQYDQLQKQGRKSGSIQQQEQQQEWATLPVSIVLRTGSPLSINILFLAILTLGSYKIIKKNAIKTI